jgi:hypothetical protein
MTSSSSVDSSSISSSAASFTRLNSAPVMSNPTVVTSQPFPSNSTANSSVEPASSTAAPVSATASTEPISVPIVSPSEVPNQTPVTPGPISSSSLFSPASASFAFPPPNPAFIPFNTPASSPAALPGYSSTSLPSPVPFDNQLNGSFAHQAPEQTVEIKEANQSNKLNPTAPAFSPSSFRSNRCSISALLSAAATVKWFKLSRIQSNIISSSCSMKYTHEFLSTSHLTGLSR